MKKILSLLLAVLMIIGMLAGCGGSGEEQKPEEKEPVAEVPAEPVDPLAPMAEPVTLKTYFEIPGPIQPEFSEEALENMVYTQKQREATNITIEYEWYAADSAEDS